MRYQRWLMVITLWTVPAAFCCPDICKCSIKSGSVKAKVDCHKRGLRVFPSNLPSDAWILKLGECVEHKCSSHIREWLFPYGNRLICNIILLCKGENGITDLKANALGTIPKVESINLERNAVKSIHPQAFSGAKQLMLLNLYGNHITKLPSRGFKVSSMEWNCTQSQHMAPMYLTTCLTL